jgi:hypothetical protein
MVGCLDAVTHTGEAVREMAGGLTVGDPLTEVRRARQGQVFGLDGRLMRFSRETSRGAALLVHFPPRAPAYARAFTTTTEYVREAQEGVIGEVAHGIGELTQVRSGRAASVC